MSTTTNPFDSVAQEAVAPKPESGSIAPLDPPQFLARPITTPTPAPTPAPSSGNPFDKIATDAVKDQPAQAPVNPFDAVAAKAMQGSGELARPAFWPALQQTAQRLGVDPDHLWRVMHFESGGKPNNVNPTSGATGLIQFMPSTAAGLGTSTGALRGMTAEQQLPYVEKYLRQAGVKPGMNFGDLYSSVLWPKAVGKPGDYVLFRKGTAAYAQNRGLDHGNKGYVTKNDAAQSAYGPYQGSSIEVPPWERGTAQPDQDFTFKSAKTGQPLPQQPVSGGGNLPPVPLTQDEITQQHQDHVLANAKALPFDPIQFVLAVQQGKDGVEPKGGASDPSQLIPIEQAGAMVAKAMGISIPQGQSAFQQVQNQLHGGGSDAGQYLNPKSVLFQQFRHLAPRIGQTPDSERTQIASAFAPDGSDNSKIDTSSVGGFLSSLGKQAQQQFIDPAAHYILNNQGGTGLKDASPVELYTRSLGTVLSPHALLNMFGGDTRPDSDKGALEQLANTGIDLAGYLVGGALEGGAKAASGSLAKQVSLNAAKFLLTQAAFQSPQTAARAMELHRQGASVVDATTQAFKETGGGFLKSLNPTTEFDPSASPSEKLNAAAMQAMTILGLGGHAFGKLGDARALEDQYSQITPPAEPFRTEQGSTAGKTLGFGPEQPLGPISPTAEHVSSPDALKSFLQTKEGNQPQDQGHVFVSPNTEEGLDYDQAVKKLGEPEHIQGRATVQKIADTQGVKGKFTDGIGDWADGAENTLIGRFDPAHTVNQLRDVAAEAGLALDQKDVLAVRPNTEGPGTLTTFSFPASDYSEPQVRQLLEQHDFKFRTLESSPDTIRATIYKEKPDSAYFDQAYKLGQYPGVQAASRPVEGGGLTGLDETGTREQARAIYNRILGERLQREAEGSGTIPPASARGGNDNLGGTPSAPESSGTQAAGTGSGSSQESGTPEATELGTPKRSLEDIQTDRASIINDLLDATRKTDLSSGVPSNLPEILKHVGRLVANLAEEGVYHGQALITHAQDYLKAAGLNLSDEQVAKAFQDHQLESSSPAEAKSPEPQSKESPVTHPQPQSTERETTGIRRSISDQEAKDRGVKLHEQQPYTTPKEAHDAGKTALTKGLIDPLKVAQEVAAKPRQLTTTEVGAFNAKHRELLKSENEVYDAIKTTPKGSPEHEALSAQLKNLLEQHETLQQGIRKGRRENSAGLAAFKMMSNLDDGTYAGARHLAEALKGSALDPKQEVAIKALQSKLDEATKARQVAENALQVKHDQLTEALAKQRFVAEQRAVNRTVKRGDLQAQKQAAIARMQKAVQSAPVGSTPFEALPEFMAGLKDLAVASIHEGAINLADVYDKVSGQLKEHGIEVSMRQVNQALSGMYDDGKPSTPSEVQIRLAELKKQAKLLSQINDAIEGKAPEKGTSVAPSETVAGMRNTLNQIIKDQGLRPAANPSVKLNKAIAEALTVLEHRREERVQPATSDTPEIAALRAKLKNIRDQIAKRSADERRQASLKAMDDLISSKLSQVEGRYRSIPEHEKAKSEPKEVTEAQRRLADASAQLKTQDQIFELERQIRDNDLQMRYGPPSPVSPRLAELQGKARELQTQKSELLKAQRPGADPVESLRLALKNALERLEAGPKPRDPKTPDTPETAALREQIKRVQKQIQAKYPKGGIDPETARLNSLARQTADKLSQVEGQYRNLRKPQLKSEAISRAKAKLADAAKQLKIQDSVMDLERQIATKTPEKTPERIKPIRSPELQKLIEKETHLKAERQQLINSMVKPTVADVVLKYRAANMLTSTSIFGKVAAQALGQVATGMPDAVAGTLWNLPLDALHRNFPKLPDVANQTIEGRANPRTNAEAYAKATTEFFKSIVDGDVKDKFKTGLGKLDVANVTRGSTKELHDAPNILNLPQRVHGALHTPTQRAAYMTEATRLTYYLAKRGVDVTNPKTIDAINGQAYAKSLQSVLLNDNALNTALQKMMSVNPSAKAVGHFLSPFTKVASNLAGRKAEYIGGVPYAGFKYLQAIRTGEVSPEQAGAILRAAKRGTTGAALFAMFYYQAKNGNLRGSGFYTPGEKKQDPTLISFKGPDGKWHDIPRFLVETIPFEFAQLALTSAKADKNPHAPKKALLALTSHAVESTPGLDAISGLLSSIEGKEDLGSALGRQAASFIPASGLLGDIARNFDKKPNDKGLSALIPSVGEPRKVDQAGFIHSLMSTIPIARNHLRTKH